MICAVTLQFGLPLLCMQNYPTFPTEDSFAVHTFLLEKAFAEQKAVISKIK